MSAGKGLVLDANILIRAALGSRVRSLLELKLTDTTEVDAELLGWLRDAYALCGPKSS